jgi:anaerobic sulfite reductase subunit A
VFAGEGRFSDTDLVKYSEIDSIQEICFDKKSEFSPKEVMLPITQTMFYFTEKEFKVPDIADKGIIVFLRSCDLHSVKRVDEIYLRNKYQDMYYKRIRDKVKFVVMGCPTSFENCFCVSMGTNKTDDYHMGLNLNNDSVELHINEEEFKSIFSGEETVFDIKFVEENKVKVNVPENISLSEVKDLELWREYDKRCVACGKCNFVCPTCTCSTTQDIFYSENENTGERRRVWASCHVDGFTDMAGGHTFRQKHGDRMRFKTMHKISDFKRRFGYHMCTGCGRCDDVCPEYISFSNCVNKLSKELEGNDE